MTREEAIQWLQSEKWENANNKYKKEWNEAFDIAIESLSADRVEVVRCGDCKFLMPSGLCTVFADECIRPSVSDFCSHGQRRKK